MKNFVFEYKGSAEPPMSLESLLELRDNCIRNAANSQNEEFIKACCMSLWNMGREFESISPTQCQAQP